MSARRCVGRQQRRAFPEGESACTSNCSRPLGHVSCGWPCSVVGTRRPGPFSKGGRSLIVEKSARAATPAGPKGRSRRSRRRYSTGCATLDVPMTVTCKCLHHLLGGTTCL